MRRGRVGLPTGGGQDPRQAPDVADAPYRRRDPFNHRRRKCLVTYVTEGIESAMAQAKGAAGDRDVHVIGAYTAQRALEAGVLDELQIHQIPVLFGSGRRLVDVLPKRVELQIVQVVDTPEATHIRYRILR